MFARIIRNDVRKSKVTTLIATLFVAAAAMLVSLAALLAIQLSGSIEALMTKAQTPHFMQMHSGTIDRERLAAFAEGNGNVEDFQVLEFLNVEGARIVLGGQSLADSAQDNGFSVQSGRFDYLLDLDGNVIHAAKGELYVPIAYMKDNSAKVGDKAAVGGRELTVAGFLRDSQMNSSLSSSKRFLVSQEDYAAIQGQGSMEYLIEFRLKELSGLGAFEAAYASAGLEANGPAVTYPLFRMINAISDGMMIAVILLMSALVVAVALMCIRFTLLAKIEEEYREIGVLKAIGLRVKDIKRLYLAKYAAMAAVGCILGYALSLLFKGPLLEQIRLSMGESGHGKAALLAGLAGTALIFLVITAYVSRVLARFKKISAADAIRFGGARERSGGAGRMGLSSCRLLDTNIFLGIKDVLSRKKLYATMLAVLVLAAFMMIVPQNLYSTISSESFSTYMGIGRADMRFDIQQTADIAAKAAEIDKALAGDKAVKKHAVLTTGTYRVQTEAGQEGRISIELGNHAVFPVQYSQGGAPSGSGELALSVLNAEALGRSIGDTLTLLSGGQAKALTVCGIYSDITNGGKTAKAVFTDTSGEAMRSVIYAELADPSLAAGKVREYADRFGYAKVSDLDDYVAKTFGSTISAVGKAAYAAFAVALLLMFLVTLLFMKLLAAKDKTSIAIMKALGFTRGDIARQYASRSLFVLLAAMALGLLLANTLGEGLAGMAISFFGASTFKFAANPLAAYLVCPLAMICSVLLATVAGAWRAGHVQISQYMKE
ncbi:ABC transporter permease [Paenibacillus sp. YN15]|uniref:ABC transporter permease n=1 Tax=Paenibacillus sp. YN15 TaxID=1742774 RepID=UPI000DCC68CA|nr:ABC transporter permease [Paenibacillus sp. YN15]RAU98897.1 ABC transporter permease [Paenibacillus sp. YN15]